MQRLRRFRPDAPALTAFALGAVLFLLVYGPSTLDVTYDSWIFNGYIGVDILQHYAGWAAFRAGEWAFPLTFTSLLSWPFGGAASLADCIPLFAIPAKLLSPLLPATFQYFGWFSLFCMAMGGYAGAKLLSQCGFSPAGQVLGSVFFAASPILLERAFQHTALAAHFLVVLALYGYCKARRQHFANVPWGLFTALAALAACVHVYFVPMVLAVAFAAAADAALHRKNAKALLPLAAPVAAALAMAFLLGFFSKADYVPGGFGQFGVNLNTFWNPASWNWATWDASYQHLHWSRFLPMLPVVGDSVGSFSYLGLGMLAGLGLFGIYAVWQCVAIWRKSGARALLQKLVSFAKRRAGLLLSCLCLCAFAVSNVVTANSRTLFTVPLPAAILRLFDMFRSSGRLIWPVYYLLVVLALWGGSSLAQTLAARMKSNALRRAAPLLALCLLFAVQGVDLSGVLAQKRTYFASPVVPQSYASPENWDAVAAPGRVLYQLEMNEDRPTALRAALAGMPTNYYLLARGSPAELAAHMAATRAALLQGEVPFPNTVFVTKDEAFAAELTAAQGARFRVLPLAGYTAFVPLDL